MVYIKADTTPAQPGMEIDSSEDDDYPHNCSHNGNDTGGGTYIEEQDREKSPMNVSDSMNTSECGDYQTDHHNTDQPNIVHHTAVHEHSGCVQHPDTLHVSDKRRKTRTCWLCEYQGNRTTNEVIRFIMDGIPHMSLDSLVEQSRFLLDEVDPGSNASTAEIKAHIECHMLHPRIKMALQAMQMSKMSKEVYKCCISADAESGEQTINPQAMRVYLSLCSQIASVYKLGEEKLIFNQSSMDK
jgi:hypothetical protein